METVEDRLNKLREERIAREKARIEKLRELNLKKYNTTNEPQAKTASNNNTKCNVSNGIKNISHFNGTSKRPITVPINKKQAQIDLSNVKPKTVSHIKTDSKIVYKVNTDIKLAAKKIDDKKSVIPKIDKKAIFDTKKDNNNKVILAKNDPRKAIKTIAVHKCTSFPKSAATAPSRKSMLPKPTQSVTNTRESVFERLYKPKLAASKPVDEVKKLQTDPNYLRKVIKNSGLIINKRHTTFEARVNTGPPVRRSISAVHFKRISKNEINNCIHKWSSISEMNKAHLKDINEDDTIKEDKVISAVKSERKKVKFLTPLPQNYNTPRPEELQARLKSWLQKRGKSLDAYQHLQCFGINHLSHREIRPLSLVATPKFELYDQENKENIALESDSDDDSYAENMNEEGAKGEAMKDWRRVTDSSCVSEIIDFNETVNTTLTSGDLHNVDELLLGALNDLTELLKEGFEWEQCARWLRAVRERFPSAPNNAAYWECRAALEERRGDLPASVQCWEEAIAKGTEHSVVEANLDQLLDKFMQLKISPNSGKRRQVDPKMVDVKNVFKSTIIRFAVQQAKLRQSNALDAPAPKYTVTPVRRSGRLSTHTAATHVRTPLRVCASVRQAEGMLGEKTLFVPNESLCGTP